MRGRISGLLVLVMALGLGGVSLPLAVSLATGRQQAVFSDRLKDTSRFAAIAQQISSDADRTALGADLTRYARLYDVAAAIVDRDGRVWIGDLGQAAADDRFLSGLHSALAGRPNPDPATIWPWQDVNLVVAVPVTRGDDVTAVAITVSPTGSLRRGIRNDLILLAISVLVALLLCAVLAGRLATWVLTPVRLLERTVGKIGAGSLSARVSAAHGPVELRALTTAFNGMADLLEQAMLRQRAFVTDAAHQLRNPLSALVLRLDLLDDTPDPSDLAATREEAARLGLILDELLTLATAHQVRDNPVIVDAVALLANRVEAWRPVAQAREISLRIDATAPRLVVVDPTLVGSALDAVIDNAIKFSPDGSEITLDTQPESAHLCINIRDRGPGLAPDELARVGDRFWRSTRHQNVPGSGLGLSIARALLTATRSSIEFAANPWPDANTDDPAPRSGMLVSLRFPLAGPPPPGPPPPPLKRRRIWRASR